MECLRMYYIASLLFLGIAVSDGADITFEKQVPDVVFVGDDVTFHWNYTGTMSVNYALLEVWTGSVFQQLAYYTTSAFEPRDVAKYAKTAEWAGDFSAKKYAFKLVNVSEFSHLKNFSLRLGFGVSKERAFTKELLFLSVLPEVRLKVSKTNVTAGDRVTIDCRIVKGRPAPTISLYHNNKLIQGETGKNLFRQEEVDMTDAGSYRCMGKNSVGNVNSEVVLLSVNPKPDKGPNGEDDPTARKGSDGLSGGAIAGIAIGIILVIVIVIIVIVVMLTRKSKRYQTNKQPTSSNDESKAAMVSKPPASERDQVWL